MHAFNRLRIIVGAWRQSLGRTIVDRLALIVSGSRIMTGPFSGMKYVTRGHCGAIAPRLIGCYETELSAICQSWIGQLSKEPATFVDIGAAEGYYAVGFLYSSPKCHTIAYEAEPSARQSLVELAETNHVSDRLETRGLASERELLLLLGTTPSVRFVMIDVEGAECDIITPKVAEQMTSAEIIIEAHETPYPGTLKTLIARFERAHDIRKIDNMSNLQRLSQIAKTGRLRWLPDFILLLFAQERRGSWLTPWLHLTPKDRRSASLG